jgi:uncharacterized protein (DUF427 family)
MNPGLHAAPWPKAARARGRRAAAVLALWAGSGMPPEAQGQTFRAEGADTGAGLGARWVAQGGTGVATADDVHALYFNPAGLAAMSGPQVSVSRQADARLRPVNFLGAAWPLPHRGALRATLAAAYYPRIHARASGAFDDGDFESLFLRYLLPGISGTFDGDIDTKTKSYRLGLGLAAGDEAPWSLGAYVERIDCRSDFCGVHAASNGFTTQSTGAVATGVGLGLRWKWSPKLTLGASLADLRTRLAVELARGRRRAAAHLLHRVGFAEGALPVRAHAWRGLAARALAAGHGGVCARGDEHAQGSGAPGRRSQPVGGVLGIGGDNGATASTTPGAAFVKAIWNNTVIAQSDDTVVVEGNHYFPESSLKREYVTFSNHRTSCPWKGQAHYYSLLVNGDLNPDAVWYYPEPSEAAAQVKGRVAFWKGVQVTE